MKEVMLEDFYKNIKEEYMSVVGLVMLFDCFGGYFIEKMVEVLIKEELMRVYVQVLIVEICVMWDEWDLRDGQLDDKLEFDVFYNGFLVLYFGCYRCDEMK